MFSHLVPHNVAASWRKQTRPPLGKLLAADAPHPPTSQKRDVLTALEDIQRAAVTPVINRMVETAEQHLAGTPLATTTRATAKALAAFQHDHLDPLIDQTAAASVALVRDYLLPLLPERIGTFEFEALPVLGDVRQQYIRLLGNPDDQQAARDPQEQLLQRQLAVATMTFGLANVAHFLAPALLVFSLPGVLYNMANWLTDGYHEVVGERRIGFMTFASLTSLAMLVTGKIWLMACWFMLFTPVTILIFKTRRRSRQRLVHMLGDTPRFVWVIHENSEMQLPFEQLQAGDIVVAGAGETIPVDGTIVSGTASIDQHMLTGEAQPAEKSQGESVYAATIVLAGRLHIRVEQAGETTVAAQIGALLNQTAAYQTRREVAGVRMSEALALPLLLLGAITLPLLGTTSAIAVMSCGMGVHVRLSGPISVLNFLHIVAEHGILVKDGQALETLAQVDTVVFDKTGTLTQEEPHVGGIHPSHGYTEAEVLQLAAAAETRQSHPIARAILQAAETHQLAIPPLDDATYEPGYGLRVRLHDGRQVRVGSARFLHAEGMTIPATLQTVQTACQQHGHSLVYVAVDAALAGAIELHTTIRPEVAEVVAALHQRGIQLAIISGDHTQPTRHLARQLGIDRVFAEVLPQEKARLVAQLQREGHTVCFVGDGINDSIALKQAHVSVSLRGATTIATDTAQVVLMDESLHQLPRLFAIAQQMDENMQRNFQLSLLPGMINIATVYLLHTGIAFAMVLSTGILIGGVGNAMSPLLHHMRTTPPALPATSNPATDEPAAEETGTSNE